MLQLLSGKAAPKGGWCALPRSHCERPGSDELLQHAGWQHSCQQCEYDVRSVLPLTLPGAWRVKAFLRALWVEGSKRVSSAAGAELLGLGTRARRAVKKQVGERNEGSPQPDLLFWSCL